MPTYRVYTTETVSYCYKVTADTENQAREKVYNGEYDDCDWCDGWGFEIADIEEEKD